MNPSEIRPEEKEIRKEDAEELNLEELDEVSGAGNPFEDVPRVPLKPIDPNLRDKG